MQYSTFLLLELFLKLTAVWDELSRFGIWEELSLGTNRRLGRIVA